MTPNFLVLLAAAVVPFVIMMFWFHPRVFGHEKWKNVASLTDEAHNTQVKPLRLMLTFVFNFLIAVGLYGAIVHAGAIVSLCGGVEPMLESETAMAFLAEVEGRFLTFEHGAFHGVLMAIFFAAPLYGYVMVFERKLGRYFFVNVGYWIICMALMGGLIGKWGAKAVEIGG